MLVEGLNIVKRHTKPRPPNEPGGVIEKPAPIHLSNVALIDPKDNRPNPGEDRGQGRRARARGRPLRRGAGLMADETTQVAEPEAPATPVPPARLRLLYEQEIRPQLQEEFGYRSPMEHPRLEKITLSMGVGEAKTNSKALDDAMDQLAVIAGQRPHITRARKSIAQFKLREGMAIGCKVTLRGNRMWEFLDRLTSVALPRIRDFRGINPDGFDGRGNYNLGLREQTIFPEIDYDRIDQSRGLNVTITTTARTDRGGPGPAPAPGTSGCRFRRRGLHAAEERGRPPALAQAAQVRPRPRPQIKHAHN